MELTIDDLAEKADLVVLGEVVSIAYQRDTETGSIYTLVTFSVRQTFKGESLPELIIRIPGGSLDGEIQQVEDAPRFAQGESAIIFLENGDAIFRVVGSFQGKFTVYNDSMVGSIPLQEFITQVNNAIAAQ
ncbi:MAG: hypothetical protein C4555_07460 [Dehalococcoidia bacterium]|nr:MAG: hypothetical protein C4555_07460 [Dehalococcoidia bacterium]